MEKLLNGLNSLLCDLNVFFRKLQNYHWNIEGKDFFIVHSKLEEYYNDVFTEIDEIGEHILILGGQPLGTLKDYLETTKIQEAENKKIKSTEIFNSLIKDYSNLLADIISIKEEADKLNQYGTSSMMDNYIDKYSKKIWMLKQSNEI